MLFPVRKEGPNQQDRDQQDPNQQDHDQQDPNQQDRDQQDPNQQDRDQQDPNQQDANQQESGTGIEMLIINTINKRRNERKKSESATDRREKVRKKVKLIYRFIPKEGIELGTQRVNNN